MKTQKFNLKGVRPSPLDERDINFHLTRFVSMEEPLPEKFNPYKRPVRNQGRHGSCVGMASAEALQFSMDMQKVFPEPEPKVQDVYFRSFVRDGSLPNKPKLKKKVYVLIDGIQSYWSEYPGIVACPVMKDIVAKGEVKVEVWVEGYKIKTHLIDFKDIDKSRMTVLYRGQEAKPMKKSIFLDDMIEPEPLKPEPEPDEDIIPDNVPPEILPLKQGILQILIDLLKSWLKFRFDVKLSGFSEESVIFSPKWIYSRCKEIDGNYRDTGTYPKNAGVVLKNQGCVEEIDMPYEEPIPENLSKREWTDAYFNEADHKIESYHRLYTPEEVKRALHNGFGVFFACRDAQLLTGLRSTDFPKYRRLQGWSAHAMAFVSWDSKGIWVKNSWGSNWGSKGYARISYDSEWFTKGIFEIWAVKYKRNING